MIGHRDRASGAVFPFWLAISHPPDASRNTPALSVESAGDHRVVRRDEGRTSSFEFGSRRCASIAFTFSMRPVPSSIAILYSCRRTAQQPALHSGCWPSGTRMLASISGTSIGWCIVRQSRRPPDSAKRSVLLSLPPSAVRRFSRRRFARGAALSSCDLRCPGLLRDAEFCRELLVKSDHPSLTFGENHAGRQPWDGFWDKSALWTKSMTKVVVRQSYLARRLSTT